MAPKLSTFQIGTVPKRNQGLRIGATRLPPRGIPRSRWKRDGYFDVWMPALAPSKDLLKWVRQKDLSDPAVRRTFFGRYERELLDKLESRQTVKLLAEIAKKIPVSVGCFCADESRCHRSRLYEVITRAAQSE